MKQDVAFHLPGKSITFKDVELPDANTPPPPTNATIHLLSREIGYGTPDRKFIAACGASWLARDGSGEHKYIHESEMHWHGHINCAACQQAEELAWLRK